MTKKATKAENQQSLFGEVDMVFNTLHTELTIVNEEIEDKYKKISSLEEKIEILESRKEEIDKSIKIVAKSRKVEKVGKTAKK